MVQHKTAESRAGCEDALHLLVDRSMRVAETALHSYRSQHKAAGDKAALLLQAVKLLSLLSKCAMPNGGDVSALFEEHMRNAANRRYRMLKSELHPPALGAACNLAWVCLLVHACMHASLLFSWFVSRSSLVVSCCGIGPTYHCS